MAKSWTLPGLLALHEELGPSAVKGPEVQDRPHFPDGYPAELDRLDSEIVWAAYLTDESGRDLDDALKQDPHTHDPKVSRLRNVVEFRFDV